MTSIAVFLFILLLLLQTPFFQNYVVEKAVQAFNENTSQTAKVSNIQIKWFDFVEIKGLRLLDHQQKVMISAENIKVDFELNQLLSDNGIQFDLVEVYNGSLNLRQYTDGKALNLVEFISSVKELLKNPEDTVARKSTQLGFGKISLDTFEFLYDNATKDSLDASRFDYSHFRLSIPGAGIQDFQLHGDTIEASVRSFAARDPRSGLNIDELHTQFMLSNSGLVLDQLLIRTQESLIQDYIALNFSGMGDLSTFIDSVEMQINLDESVISRRDLKYFADLPTGPFVAAVTAKIDGKVSKLTLSDVDLKTGNQTHIEGAFDFYGLPAIEETFIDLRIKESQVHPNDLDPFLAEKANALDPLGKIGLNGRFLGFINDFVANATIKTRKGNVKSDLNLKFPKSWKNAQYSGNVRLEKLELGDIIGDTNLVQKINFEGRIQGKGLTIENANFYTDAKLWDSEIKGYTYREVLANGEFASKRFNGDLTINDPNCMMDLHGTIDLATQPEQIKLESNIRYIDFQAIQLSKDTLTLQSQIFADIQGISLDSMQGQIDIYDLALSWREDSISLDSIQFSSVKNRDKREIEVNLPEVSVRMDGNFMFTNLISDVKLLTAETKSYFSGEEDPFRNSQSITSEDYYIDFAVDYEDVTKYIALLDQPLYIAPSGKIEGTFYQRENATLSFFTELDSVNYDGAGFNENVIEVNMSKDLDSAAIIASAYINSKKQIWPNVPETQNFSAEAVWYNNQINFSTQIKQSSKNNSAYLKGEIKLRNDQFILKLLPSQLIAFGDQWFINPYNSVTFTKSGDIDVDRLELYQNEQSIQLSGEYSGKNETDLELKIKDLDITVLNTIIPVKLGGILNTDVALTRPEKTQSFVLLSDIQVADFELNDFLVGRVKGVSQWDPANRGLKIDLDVQRKGVNTIAVDGYYTPTADENSLDISTKFNQAGLTLLDPFFVGLFSNIKGYADGQIDISGSLTRPILNGSAKVQQGAMTFDYLGTSYAMDGTISFDNEAINFEQISLNDREGDRATLSGKIYHDGFKNFRTDLNIDAREFLFLNTTSTDNSLYYGTANATGNITVKGPFEDLVIRAKAITEKGTKLFIPLSESGEVSQKDYITFVDFSDTTSTVDLEEIVKASISGVKLDFEIDVTPDAYVELIFDIRTGDIIRGKGEGNLKMTLDTNGDFELFGDISITEGAYNFTIPNFINKEFQVVPGSTISWYGDPYSGSLNLEATYRQLASFDDFFGNTDQDQTVSQKYPVLVVLHLDGDMLTPDISFEVELEDSQLSPTSTQQSVITRINEDEQELNRQVFSLLILRKFSAKSSFDVGGGGTAVGSSLSEFLSNQFSYFISQVDENLEVDVDLASLDQNAFNTFQLRLSYTFLDGRLRVSGGGAFPQAASEDASATTFIGDWSVRYLLTQDGHLRVKAFSQTEQLANQTQRETGVSFQYIKAFDNFKELLSKSREKAIQNRSQESNSGGDSTSSD